MEPMDLRRNLFLILSVVLTVILTAMAWQTWRVERLQAKRLAELNEEAEPLERERENLWRELSSLQRDAEREPLPPAAEQLLVTELDEDLYTRLYPLMRDRDLHGILALSREQLPGQEGKISFEEFNELLEKGWTLCLSFPGGDFDDWYDAMSDWLEDLSLPRPEAVYFPEWDPTLVDKLRTYGFTIAIQQESEQIQLEGDEEAALILYVRPWNDEDDEGAARILYARPWNDEGDEGEVRILYARPWNYEDVVSFVDNLAAKGGTAVFTVSFSEGPDAFDETGFVNMLDYVGKYIQRGRYYFTDFAEGMALQEDTEFDEDRAEAAYRRELERIQAEIDDLDQRIHAIYANWNLAA